MIPLLYQLSYAASEPESVVRPARKATRISRVPLGFRRFPPARSAPVKTAVADLVRALLELVLPGRCLACGEYLGTSSKPLCSACLPQAPWPPPACGRCLGRQGDPCALCRVSPPRVPLIRLGPHEPPLRTMLLAAKWGGGGDRVPVLARWLAEACRGGLGSPVPIEAVTSVPRSRWRRLRHGRPLSESLAGTLAVELRRPLLPPPRRHGGPPQAGLGAAARRRAPHGVFFVPPSHRARIAGRTILLVDDVITTGATLTACAEALEVAGAKQVIGAVLTFAP